jgi:hypothetical protein
MRKTEEEKVAGVIADKLDKVTLNLDEVGRYLAGMPNIYYNRLMIVAEAAEYEKEATMFETQKDFLF